jgi:hypothetical protein
LPLITLLPETTIASGSSDEAEHGGAGTFRLAKAIKQRFAFDPSLDSLSFSDEELKVLCGSYLVGGQRYLANVKISAMLTRKGTYYRKTLFKPLVKEQKASLSFYIRKSKIWIR